VCVRCACAGEKLKPVPWDVRWTTPEMVRDKSVIYMCIESPEVWRARERADKAKRKSRATQRNPKDVARPRVRACVRAQSSHATLPNSTRSAHAHACCAAAVRCAPRCPRRACSCCGVLVHPCCALALLRRLMHAQPHT
jgi:hypothetical protein